MLQYSALPAKTLEALKTLKNVPELNQFALVGGTALALHWGHRISVDLDFFSPSVFDPDKIISALNNAGKLHIADKNHYSVFATFNDVKLDLIKTPYTWFSEPPLIDGFRIAELDDIAALKMNALYGRGVKKDFYDFYFLLKKYSLTELTHLFTKKFPNTNPMGLLLSLNYFEDAEQSETPITTDQSLTWEEVKKFITQQVKEFM